MARRFNCKAEIGEGGLEKVVLSDGEGLSVEVYTFGATVTSFVSGGVERLFVSERAVFNGVKAIRGGIPLVFPQFGTANMPQHGFARTSFWSWTCGCDECDDSEGRLILRLKNNEATEQLWPHSFELIYNVTLTSTSLRCELLARNSGNGVFEAHALLHSYIRLPIGTDITHLETRGFAGFSFIDKMAANETSVENREVVTVTSETDRIYIVDSPDSHLPDILLSSSGKSFMVVRKGASLTDSQGVKTILSPDVVFWNAWAQKSASLPDLGEGAYKSYICVEPGTVSNYVSVAPGAVLSIETTLAVM